jgi:hypothetical protein
VIVMNFVIDIFYAVIDPRARADRRSEGATAKEGWRQPVPESATQPASAT